MADLTKWDKALFSLVEKLRGCREEEELAVLRAALVPALELSEICADRCSGTLHVVESCAGCKLRALLEATWKR